MDDQFWELEKEDIKKREVLKFCKESLDKDNEKLKHLNSKLIIK